MQKTVEILSQTECYVENKGWLIQVVPKETAEKEDKVFTFHVVTQEEYHPQVQTLMATIYSPKKTKGFPLHQKLSFVINTGAMRSTGQVTQENW